MINTDKLIESHDIKCFLLDMDGTIYLSGHPIDGAVEAISRLRKRARVIFLTNNTSVGQDDYVKKLNSMGVEACKNDIYTAGNATIDWLKANNKDKDVYLVGTQKLTQQFIGSQIQLCENDPRIVVIGFDTSLTYQKLEKACSFIRKGVPYIATHPDINCPTIDGYIPDVGSFLALIEKSTQKKPIVICGKPFSAIGEGIARMTNLQNDQIAMVGDRLSTDIQFAINNGFYSILVLSGEASLQDAKKSGLKIDLILESIAKL